MKIKKEKTLGSRRIVTYVLAQKDAYNLHEAARFLKGNEWLVPYGYEAKGKGYCVQFDVTGLVSLGAFLSQPLLTSQFIQLLNSVNCFLHTTPQTGMPLRDVRLAPGEVYVCAHDGHLRFVLMPVCQANTSSRDVHDLIYFIAQHCCVSDAAACGFVREQVLQFLAVPELFSVTEFRKFVAALQGTAGGVRTIPVEVHAACGVSEALFANLAREDELL